MVDRDLAAMSVLDACAGELEPAARAHRFQALMLLGLAHYRRGEAGTATAALREALTLAPDDDACHTALALALEAGGDGTRAYAHHLRAVALRPDSALALTQFGTLQRLAGDADGAVAICQRALVLDANHAGALTALGAAFLALDACQPAEACFRLALATGGEAADALTGMGEVLRRTQRDGEAVPFFLRAMEIDDDDVAARMGLAMLYRSPGWLDKAVDQLKDTAATAVRRLDALAQDTGASLDIAPEAGTAQACLRFAARPPEGWRAPGPMARLTARLRHIAGLFLETGCDDAALDIYDRLATPPAEGRPAEGRPAEGRPPEGRRHGAGHAGRVAGVRPVAGVCQQQGWPFRTVVPASAFTLAADSGAVHSGQRPGVFLAFAENAEILPSNSAVIVGSGTAGGDALLLDGLCPGGAGAALAGPGVAWATPEGRVLMDRPELSPTVIDEAILLGGEASPSAGLLDWASRLAVLERFPELSHLPVLVAASLPDAVAGFYALLGLDPARMIRLPDGLATRVRRLWLPSLAHGHSDISPLHVDFVRRRLAGLLNEGRRQPRRRLLLSRREAGWRALLNEAGVLAALAPFGIKAVVPDDLSPAGQVTLFSSAELVVSPFGGGLTAMLFAPPGAACVELAHSRCPVGRAGILTGLLAQRYRRVVGQPHGNRGSRDCDHDFTVSPDEVVAAVRAVLPES